MGIITNPPGFLNKNRKKKQLLSEDTGGFVWPQTETETDSQSNTKS